MITDDGIQEGKQFAHTSRQSDFFLLSALDQTLVEETDKRIEFRC